MNMPDPTERALALQDTFEGAIKGPDHHAGAIFRRLASHSRAGSASPCGASSALPNLWVTEFVLTYDGQPSYTVSIMEFKDGKVARETQYFGDAFEPGPSRAQWIELMR